MTQTPAVDTTEEQLKDAFNTYYANTLYPFLKSKEDIRVKYLNRFIALLLLALIILPMIALGMYTYSVAFQVDIDWGLFMIPLAVAIYIVQGPYSKYDSEVKTQTMHLFIRFFEGFSYARGRGLNQKELVDSHIFPPYDRESADDCFSGTYDGVGVRVCEETLKQVRHSSKGTRTYTVFQGIGIELDMNKSFSGQTVVLKDLGIFNRLKRIRGMENVKLEDVVFEKEFEVYATDQIEARYLLTTAFMERLLKLKELYKGNKIQASFFGNKILIAVQTNQNMFEPCSFFKTNLKRQKVDVVFNQIMTVLSIVHVLKLNDKR
jgi:hypothetical protein